MNRFVIAFVFWSSFALSETSARLSLTLVTDDAPPHMIKATNSGIDIDIVRGVLHNMGYRTELKYAPLERARRMVATDQADIMTPTFSQEDKDNLFVSHPVIQYRPTVFTMAGSPLRISSFADLSSLRVATFQGAEGFFGDPLTSVVSGELYREMHDMSVLPDLLFRGRADAVLLDFYIFHFYALSSIEAYQPERVVASDFIPPVNAHAVFNDPELRDAFNLALSEYRAAGSHQRVIERYIGPKPTTPLEE